MMIMLIIFAVLVILGFMIGYATAKMNLEKEADGFLHIVTETEEPQPYIFLELKDDHAKELIEDAEFVSIKVLHD